MRILIADDELELTRALKILLERERFSVDAVASGQEALNYIENTEYDAIILDIMMPYPDGIEVLKHIRSQGVSVPVMLLTAKSGIDDRVAGLDAGADDYLPKPFSINEFMARVRALVRRRPVFVQEKLSFGKLVLDCSTFEMSYEGKSERLSNKEFQMMELLMRNSKTIISSSQFMERIWGFESDTEINVVWVNIAYLRKKLQNIGAQVAIRSVRGVGYTLEELGC